jgi:hypothetical protein
MSALPVFCNQSAIEYTLPAKGVAVSARISRFDPAVKGGRSSLPSIHR